MTQVLKYLFKQNAKRIFVFLIPILAVGFDAAFKNFVVAKNPVAKTLEITFYANSAYPEDVYKGTTAKVQLSILKYRKNKFDEIYKTTFETSSITKLPSHANAFLKTIDLTNFNEEKEVLVATYTVSYESNGSILKYNKHILIPKREGNRMVAVAI